LCDASSDFRAVSRTLTFSKVMRKRCVTSLSQKISPVFRSKREGKESTTGMWDTQKPRSVRMSIKMSIAMGSAKRRVWVEKFAKPDSEHLRRTGIVLVEMRLRT